MISKKQLPENVGTKWTQTEENLLLEELNQNRGNLTVPPDPLPLFVRIINNICLMFSTNIIFITYEENHANRGYLGYAEMEPGCRAPKARANKGRGSGGTVGSLEYTIYYVCSGKW
jgi:hypothetical protein